MSEHENQVALIQWCDLFAKRYPELDMIFAIPNGAKLPYTRDKNGVRVCRQAKILVSEGLKKGVPDLFLPVARRDYHGLFIEMKFGANKTTPDQDRWGQRLAEQGYCFAVCYTANEAVMIIKEYLGITEEL